jgi:hypothetical protein
VEFLVIVRAFGANPLEFFAELLKSLPAFTAPPGLKKVGEPQATITANHRIDVDEEYRSNANIPYPSRCRTRAVLNEVRERLAEFQPSGRLRISVEMLIGSGRA